MRVEVNHEYVWRRRFELQRGRRRWPHTSYRTCQRRALEIVVEGLDGFSDFGERGVGPNTDLRTAIVLPREYLVSVVGMPKTFDNVNGRLAHHLSVWTTDSLSITLSESIVS